MNLHTTEGTRKYLTPAERAAFLQTVEGAPREIRTFAATLVHTGCRISEALALTPRHFDFSNGTVAVETLKRSRRGIFRAIPVPPDYLDVIDLVHNVRARQRQRSDAAGTRLWPWSRGKAWLHTRSLMRAAGIYGSHATPRGLRHAFGIKAVASGVPLNLVQRWLGHAQLSTTATYVEAIDEEARTIAARMWA